MQKPFTPDVLLGKVKKSILDRADVQARRSFAGVKIDPSGKGAAWRRCLRADERSLPETTLTRKAPAIPTGNPFRKSRRE